MLQVTTSDDIKQLGTILCVFAHPDDETYSCAGIMAAAIRNGQKVACVTATKGELGIQNPDRWPADRLGDIRAAEMEAALHCIGCTNHHWLGYKDGNCKDISDQEGATRVREFIDQYKPNTILTFGPDGLTGHPDHQSVSRWATLAAGHDVQVYYLVERQDAYENYLKEADKKLNIYFMIDHPPVRRKEECDIYFELGPELCALKREALAAMPSQTSGMLQHFTPEQFSLVFCAEAFIKA